MTREEKVLNYLQKYDIPYVCYNHPEGKTIEEAKRWWRNDGSVHCKNIFLRNHKGNKHYLVSFNCDHDLDIHDLEQRLKAVLTGKGLSAPGKLSFASPERMLKYLDIEPGSVSPFGLINDTENHVHFFIDETLKDAATLRICLFRIEISIKRQTIFIEYPELVVFPEFLSIFFIPIWSNRLRQISIVEYALRFTVRAKYDLGG